LLRATLTWRQGVDLFDGAYLAALTAAGYALAFPLCPEADLRQQQQQQQQQQLDGQQGRQAEGAGSDAADAGSDAADAGSDASKLNLRALAYRRDKRPLLPGCACFACGSHSRAYVHHLLQAHEMTAQVGGWVGGAGVRGSAWRLDTTCAGRLAAACCEPFFER
jgi:queuine tRNA-ribosyltransferase subunit QTRTD1